MNDYSSNLTCVAIEASDENMEKNGNYGKVQAIFVFGDVIYTGFT